MRAGIREFERFGPYNVIDALAGGDILRHDAVVQLPYADVFAKLVYDKAVAKYQKKLARIMREKIHAKKM